MSYGVVEVFKTLQGEGYHAGRPAVFLRLAGCNMWSGRDDTRHRDALAHGAECPLWCDTDFNKRFKLSAEEVVDRVLEVADNIRFVVITGGEPLLQLEDSLLTQLRKARFSVAVETNGTVAMSNATRVAIDWVTCSPKQAPDKLQLVFVDELKVVFPAYDPEAYRAKVPWVEHLYVQPLAYTTGLGRSLIDRDNTEQAIKWVQQHPEWKLSVQTHKVLGLP